MEQSEGGLCLRTVVESTSEDGAKLPVQTEDLPIEFLIVL